MGKSPKSPPPPKYTANDGWVSEDPNQVNDRNRQLQLAAALGFDPAATNLESWTQGLDEDTANIFGQYNAQGLTAADYRAEQRLKEQEAQAKAAEEQRKQSIADSRAAIDSQFSVYDDPYYSGISNTVLDFYLPQLDDQFKKAQDQLEFDLARTGQYNTTEAGKKRADLQSQYDLQRSGVTDKASNATLQAKENVSGAKSQLYTYADAAADPAAVNDRLASETSRINAYAPELTPMGQLFTDYLTPVLTSIGTGIAAEAQGYRGFGTGLFNDTKSGSYSVKR